MMLQYLENFFREYKFNESDALYLLDVYKKIDSDKESSALWNSALKLYENDINCDYSRIIAIADEVALRLYLKEYTLEYLIFVCMTKAAKKAYIERGIDLDIFYASMLDLKYKLEEGKMVKGVLGFFADDWFIGFFKLTRFMLGRLQFEVKDFGYYYEKDGVMLTPESQVINIHIPRTGKPIDEASCNLSFESAKAFFADKLKDRCVFVCHSWLLYPENKTILSPNSNIYKFMSKFDIVDHGVYKDNEDLWRLFDTDEKIVDKLPADTSARRAYIHHLKKEGKTGWGYGVFLF